MNCMLTKHGECCCKCKSRLRAREQYSAPGIPDNSWACIAFAFGEPVAYIGDFEHGACELFRPVENSPHGEKGDFSLAAKRLGLDRASLVSAQLINGRDSRRFKLEVVAATALKLLMNRDDADALFERLAYDLEWLEWLTDKRMKITR